MAGSGSCDDLPKERCHCEGWVCVIVCVGGELLTWLGFVLSEVVDDPGSPGGISQENVRASSGFLVLFFFWHSHLNP
jgi:hypothetical protein